jgi:hypothetical protein
MVAGGGEAPPTRPIVQPHAALGPGGTFTASAYLLLVKNLASCSTRANN